MIFSAVPEAEVQEDYKKFCRLKELRNDIFHGEDFSEKDLPVDELATLLRKYVLAHIETPNQALNTDVPTGGTPVSQNVRHEKKGLGDNEHYREKA